MFLSSTFRDMHGERDILTRYVFPELRARAKQFNIQIYEVDLRWGITEEQTRGGQTLGLCLDEIAQCNFFVGILGDRYGWVPENYLVPNVPRFDWVATYPKGRSVTELEMHCAALHAPHEAHGRAFFLFRDSTFTQKVPENFRSDFETENSGAVTCLRELRDRVTISGLDVFLYQAEWGGVLSGNPVASGLTEFASHILEKLWVGVCQQFSVSRAVAPLSTLSTTANDIIPLAISGVEAQLDCVDDSMCVDNDGYAHVAFAASLCQQFVGRVGLLHEMAKRVEDLSTQVLFLTGVVGIGKTSILAAFMDAYIKKHSSKV